MVRRGREVREHMLYVAKDLFLEEGFERASMDEIAARAGVSKRTVYAHFERKELLYLAVIELVRALVLKRLGTPVVMGGTSAEEGMLTAVADFCGRFLGTLLYGPSIRMSRMVLAEARRFPEGAAQYYEAVFEAARERLGAFVAEACGVGEARAMGAAEELLGRVMFPRHTRALFGVDGTAEEFAGECGTAAIAPEPIRRAAAEVLRSLRQA